MKERFYVLTAFVIFLVSCERNDVGPQPCKAFAGADTVVFEGNQPVFVFETCTNELSVAVTDINDSRCPEGAVCFTKGSLSVSLRISNQFIISLQQGIPKDTVYQGKQYSFTLTDVKPHPIYNGPIADRKIFIQIIKQ